MPVQVDVQFVPHLQGPTEYLIWLRVPAAGGDGILLGACHSEMAAKAIADAFTSLLEASCHSSR